MLRGRWVRVPLSPFQQRVSQAIRSRTPQLIQAPTAVPAGVALILGSDPDAILLIRRAERVGDPWSGHMGLPGGRRDVGDADLVETAVREVREEVGIILGGEGLLGSLDDVAPRNLTKLPVVVRPFVFAVSGHPPLQPNDEVARAFWLEVETLRDPRHAGEVTVTLGGMDRTFPAFNVGEGTVWGMTERILTSLFDLL